MSIMSSICADADLEVVRAAVARAMAKATTEEAKILLQEVLRECEENICE